MLMFLLFYSKHFFLSGIQQSSLPKVLSDAFKEWEQLANMLTVEVKDNLKNNEKCTKVEGQIFEQ